MRIKALLLTPIVLLAACSPSAEQPSPSSSSVKPAISSSGAATATCRLPVTHSEDTGQPGGRYVSGFLTYPSGQFEPDARGAYAWDDARKAFRSPIAPVLYGPGPTAFSRATSRWLPVGSDSVSPDGLRYAYAEPFEGRLHLVTVKTGDDRIISLPAGEPYAVARFVADGIYLMRAWEGLPRGLYKVDLPGGRLTTISEEALPAEVEPGVAWLFAIDEADPHPVENAYLGALPNELLRRDLKTGSTTIWFYRPGQQLDWIGVDSKGHPIVSAVPQETDDDWLITAPGVATNIDLQSPQIAWADRRAILSSPNTRGIVLPKAAGILVQPPGQPFFPAGECL
jgi:hypothetical protein